MSAKNAKIEIKDIDFNETYVKNWMYNHLKKNKFINAMSLSDSFLLEHNITDVLDPSFSVVVDTAYAVASEMNDKKMQELN